MGDYNTLVSTNGAAWFIWTDTRNREGCTAVDDDPSVKPAPPVDCPHGFGKSDVFVAKATP